MFQRLSITADHYDRDVWVPLAGIPANSRHLLTQSNGIRHKCKWMLIPHRSDPAMLRDEAELHVDALAQ
jgi:hypothetical protein